MASWGISPFVKESSGKDDLALTLGLSAFSTEAETGIPNKLFCVKFFILSFKFNQQQAVRLQNPLIDTTNETNNESIKN